MNWQNKVGWNELSSVKYHKSPDCAVHLLVVLWESTECSWPCSPLFPGSHLAPPAPCSRAGDGGRGQPGGTVTMIPQHKAGFVLPMLPATPPWAAVRSICLQQVQSWKGWKFAPMVCIPQINIALSKNENTSVIFFLILAASPESLSSSYAWCVPARFCLYSC